MASAHPPKPTPSKEQSPPAAQLSPPVKKEKPVFTDYASI